MESLKAFARGLASQGERVRTFDWIKAANIIKANPDKDWYAGLSSDLEWTGGKIWDGSEKAIVKNTTTYLSSSWATPVIYDSEGDETDCWVYQDTVKWNSGTQYPEEFMSIIQ